MDAHAWVGFAAVPTRCGKSLAALLTGKLSLSVVLDDLLAREQRAGRARWHWAAG
jgi:hypothetical protein